MTAPTVPFGHYVTAPDGARTWVGPTRGEVLMLEQRVETLRQALLAVVALSSQGSVCEVANAALEKTR